MTDASSSTKAPTRRVWRTQDASTLSLDAYLRKYRPSITKESGQPGDDGWIWVRGARDAKADRAEQRTEEAMEKGNKLLDELCAIVSAVRA